MEKSNHQPTRSRIFDKEGLKAFGKNLKVVRAKYEVSQEELAHKAEIAHSQITRIERASANPTLSTIFAMAKALKIHPSKLFADMDWPYDVR